MPDKKKRDRPRITSEAAASRKATDLPQVSLPPDLLAELERIAGAQEARAMAQIVDLVRDLASIGGEASDDLIPDLGIGGGPAKDARTGGMAMPHEELLGGFPRGTGGEPPANASPSERGGARAASDAARPSSDPASWLSGAAGSDYRDPKTGATIHKDHATGIVEKRTTQDHSGGATTTTVTVYNPQTGSSSHTQTTRGRDGRVSHRIQIIDNRDGSSEGQQLAAWENGSVSQVWARDPSGRMTTDYWQYDDNGRQTAWDRLANPERGPEPVRGGGIDRLPTDDHVSDLGRRLGGLFSRPQPSKKPEPTKVNPGDPDDSGPRGSRLDPGESIVVNPALEERQHARRMSAAAARHWRNWLLEKAGGRVNPEGGGTGAPS